MKNLPIGRQNFKALIDENLVYIDKTQQIFELISKGRLYFLSRPRRFGKSLLLSTFRYIFEGQKELFQNLYIGKEANYDWINYPVLQFNFAAYGHQVENLEEYLRLEIHKYAKQYSVDLAQTSLSLEFRTLVEQLSKKGNPVVILIDEYDKPIVDFLLDIDKARKNQKVLRDFFSPLKDLDAQGHLRFLFITGVYKFNTRRVFSDLGNLVDLTIHSSSVDIVGITQDELLLHFEMYIQRAVQIFQMSREELLHGLKLWYNGYSFDGKTTLYNPASIVSFFSQNHFGNFWFATDNPAFLIETIQSIGLDAKDFENKKISSTYFDKFSLDNLEILSLLFQKGYLTIKKMIQGNGEIFYYLNYPNKEVHKALVYSLKRLRA